MTPKYELHTDNDLADIREQLYSPRGLVDGRADGNDESAVTAFHKVISKKLTGLCGDDDVRSRGAGVEITLKLAVYGTPLSCARSSLADGHMKLSCAG